MGSILRNPALSCCSSGWRYWPSRSSSEMAPMLWFPRAWCVPSPSLSVRFRPIPAISGSGLSADFVGISVCYHRFRPSQGQSEYLQFDGNFSVKERALSSSMAKASVGRRPDPEPPLVRSQPQPSSALLGPPRHLQHCCLVQPLTTGHPFLPPVGKLTAPLLPRSRPSSTRPRPKHPAELPCDAARA